MKTMKKIFALALAIMMVMSLVPSAFATDGDTSYTITINNASAGYEYEAYQIFAGTLYKGVLSDITWGSGVDSTTKKNEDDAYSKLMVAVKDITVGETKPFTDCTDAVSVAVKLAEYMEKDNAVAQAFADVVAQYLSDTKVVSSYDKEKTKYTISVGAPGYYLVKNSAVPEATDTTPTGAYTRYILNVVGNVEVTHKGTVPSVEKWIVEDDDDKKENEASIGDVVSYKIVGTLPSNIADYSSYFYQFTDTLSKGLTLFDPEGDATNNITVTVAGVNVTEHFNIVASEYDETNGTTITVKIDDLLGLENKTEFKDKNISQATQVEVTYDAVLNEHAIVGTSGNKNDVYLTYSNDPNHEGSGTGETPHGPVGVTPKDEVWTYTTDLIVIKVDGEGNRLEGAKFKLEGNSVTTTVVVSREFVEAENGTYYKLKDDTFTEQQPTSENEDAYESTEIKYVLTDKVAKEETNKPVSLEVVVGEDGDVKFTGLGAGTYTITELEAPAGYNKLTESITVTIAWDDAAEKENDCTWTYTGTDKDSNEACINTVTVINQAGSTLPETGGIGTTLFYVIGGGLVLAAVVLLVTKKRMSIAE